MPHVRPAFGKVNLALAVAPPLPPGDQSAGMHPIASWMHAIDLSDELEFERLAEGSGVRFGVSWADDAPRPTPIDWPASTDLCVRAVHALSQACSQPVDVSIVCRKRIPVGAGLGGGSSDAATTLIAINELFDLNLTLESLRTIAAGLGSDIAFFLDETAPPKPAIVGGLGDEIERLAPTNANLLLCIPSFSCATGPVYRAFDSLSPEPLQRDAVRSLAKRGRIRSDELFNDLAAAAFKVTPELSDLRARIEDALGQAVHVTGSGSAMFALADEADFPRVSRALPDVAFVLTRLI